MNRSHSTDAIILRTSRIGEIHRGVVMLCREEGLVRAIAHGANSERGKLRGSTVPFCYGKAYLYTNPQTQSTKITDMDTTEFHAGLRDDLRKYYTASLWAELVLKTFATGGSPEEMFDLMRDGLAELQARPAEAVDLVTVQFVWRFLRIAGSQPDLELCACCGEVLGESDSVIYIPSEHGFCSVAHGCAREGADGRKPWSPGAVGYLRHTGSVQFSDALRVTPPRDTAAQMKRQLYSIIQDLVETPLNTLRTGAGII